MPAAFPASISAFVTPAGLRAAKRWLDGQPTTTVVLVLALLWLGGDKLFTFVNRLTGADRVLARIDLLESRILDAVSSIAVQATQ